MIENLCDLDLDLQGQIGFQTCKLFVLNFKLTHLEFCIYTYTVH